jgi:hypothetical protein
MSGAGGPYRELYFTAEGLEIDQNVNRLELAKAVRPGPRLTPVQRTTKFDGGSPFGTA